MYVGELLMPLLGIPEVTNTTTIDRFHFSTKDTND